MFLRIIFAIVLDGLSAALIAAQGLYQFLVLLLPN